MFVLRAPTTFHWLLRVQPCAGVCVRRLRVCDHANAHCGHRVASAGILGRYDPASIHGGFAWGLAEALADQLGLDLTVGEVPVTDLVAGWLHSADIDLAQVSATKERATSPTAQIVAAREGLSVPARFDQVESIVGSP